MLVLEILHGAAPRRAYRFPRPAPGEAGGPPISLGRGAANTIPLGDFHLSSEHAHLVWLGGQLVFRDLRSTNGSAVERAGRRLTVDASVGWELALADGDVLLMGNPAAPVRVAVALRGAGPGTLDAGDAAPGDEADDAEDDASHDRLIASRSIVDLPAVAVHLEQNPAGALRVYKALAPLGAGLDHAAVLDAVVTAAFALLPRASHVALLLRDERDTARFALAIDRARPGLPQAEPAGAPFRASRALLRRVLAQRAGVLTANAQEELATSESILAGQIRSILAVPLWRGDDIIGLLQADNRRAAGMLVEADLEAALLLGAQAALAIENAGLVQRLRAAEERLRGENGYLRRREGAVRFANIIGEAPAMKALLAQLQRVLDTRATVFIEGETGTGKELVASGIHHQSQRRDKMFVAQNCAALPENLLESELFGHRRGAFTGAESDKKGLFEIADGGTLFLDEMGEMPLALQAKLLRVLQEGTIRPVGATVEKQVDVRIVCATHRDLAAEVERGRFRQDLYYRLMVFPVKLPPLRERREDVPLLAAHFLERYRAEYRADVPGFTPEALDALAAHEWPGNIRELENEVQRLVIQAEDGQWIEATDLSPRLRKIEGTVARVAPKAGTLKEMMDQVERWLLAEALRDHGGNKTRTAATLGITREGLHKKLAKFGV